MAEKEKMSDQEEEMITIYLDLDDKHLALLDKMAREKGLSQEEMLIAVLRKAAGETKEESDD